MLGRAPLGTQLGAEVAKLEGYLCAGFWLPACSAGGSLVTGDPLVGPNQASEDVPKVLWWLRMLGGAPPVSKQGAEVAEVDADCCAGFQLVTQGAGSFLATWGPKILFKSNFGNKVENMQGGWLAGTEGNRRV